jgi:glucose uptake protein GlcU
MGLSLTSAMIGLGLATIGVILLILHKQRKVAMVFLIMGFVLIVVPYSYIYFFLD